MPNGLSAITGLQGYVNPVPEADPADIQGGPVNPAHAQLGEEAEPYPWENYAYGTQPHGPFGPENELLGDSIESQTLGAGQLSDDPTADLTPYRGHAGPMPRGIGTSVSPDEISRQLEQSAGLHAVNTNAGAARNFNPTMNPLQDDWRQIWEVTPGESMLSDVPAQIKSGSAPGGFGSHGREQTFARQNEFGFDSRHQHRRYAQGSIPGNYYWMRPGGRPMIKSLPGPARPAVGGGSPFNGQDVGIAFDTHGAILTDPANEYIPPPTPYVAPAPAYDGDSAPAIALW